MDADRSKAALSRIEAALARLEGQAVAARGNPDAGELAGLQAKHARLRSAVQTSLEQLDQLIEGAQG